ncbi:MAG: hypothetical protein Q8K82_00395, partial [Gemmatimonadaceae bacterium]|nr:hypothetical protein [Gemmatimonadaceae bacterium]
LNRHVFGYRGAPLKKLQVGVDGDQLVQVGVMRKGVDLPFKIRATMTLTPDGRIRLHPTSVRVIGVGMGRVMRLFGMRLQSLIKLQPGHGAQIEGDDFILDPTEMLPPPKIRGRLTSVGIKDGRVVQSFGVPNAERAPLFGSGESFPNYMYFRGGALRFGKLTMADADLALVDQEPKSSFDFSLAGYNDQLVAGYSKSTQALGLVVHMPDFASLKRAPAPKPPKPPKPRIPRSKTPSP